MTRHLLIVAFAAACSDSAGGGGDAGPTTDARQPPAPSCAPAQGGGTAVSEPVMIAGLEDRWHEGWLASPAVADLDGDGVTEIVVARHGRLLVWHLDGTIVWSRDVEGRCWASPVVADLLPGRPGLEVALTSAGNFYAWDAAGTALPGFPSAWRDEMRSLAAGDIDGDGQLELAAVTTNGLDANGQYDVLYAIEMDGSPVAGFPPNTTGAAGCDDACYVYNGYDQNIAIGDVDGDDVQDIFVTQDNAYLSLHDGTGRAFDSDPIFQGRTKFLGVRFLHDYDLARQGWADDEETAHQAHFTNSAPAIADVDGDGQKELIVLASVQNASQSDRFRGVALWVLRHDGTRPTAWIAPFHAPDYLAGLWDFDGTNVVGATNQVSVADLDPDRAGPEMVFAGFDGRIHVVDSNAQEVWQAGYTTDDRVLTGGVLVVDLSGDGVPEIVFASYSTQVGKSALFVLDAAGNEKARVALPGRGAMAAPTLADADGDGALDILVNLKDSGGGVLVFAVAGAKTNCLPWPTGRANLLRSGYVPR
jgi:hypothetical protein